MVSARNSRTQGLRILKLQPDLFLGAMVSSAAALEWHACTVQPLAVLSV